MPFVHDQDRFKKLPKWAQNSLLTQARTIEELVEKVTELTEERKPSEGTPSAGDISWSVLLGEEHKIPRRAAIKCFFSNQRLDYISVYFREESGKLALGVSGNFSISVEPRAANHIYIIPKG
jgi:hypothetical protein